MKPLVLIVLFVSILEVSFCDPAGPGLREKVPCIDNGRFYRNPNRDPAYVWSAAECSKYHLCIDGEIFNFECSTGKHMFLLSNGNIRVKCSYLKRQCFKNSCLRTMLYGLQLQVALKWPVGNFIRSKVYILVLNFMLNITFPEHIWSERSKILFGFYR